MTNLSKDFAEVRERLTVLIKSAVETRRCFKELEEKYGWDRDPITREPIRDNLFHRTSMWLEGTIEKMDNALGALTTIERASAGERKRVLEEVEGNGAPFGYHGKEYLAVKWEWLDQQLGRVSGGAEKKHE